MATPGDYGNYIDGVDVVWDSGSATSESLPLYGCMLTAIQKPSGTVTNAAAITLEGSFDGTTYGEVYDKTGAAVTFNINALAAGDCLTIDPTITYAYNFVRFSGASNQSGDIAIKVGATPV